MSDAQSEQRSHYAFAMHMLQQRGFAANTLIDIGAAEGAFFLYRGHSKLFPTARHFFIDAMQENEAAYRKLAPKFGTGYEITALSCMEGEVLLRVDPDFYNTHIEHLQPETAYAATRRVPVSTLDRVVERHALQPPFVLKLDVQGGELDVLRGGLRTLDEAVVVTTEINIFAERDSLVELLAFMQGIGWALYDLTDLAYYPSDATFYQCYATFIPKSMDFRRNARWCTPDQEGELLKGLQRRRAEALKAVDDLVARTPS
jgi:FkbM family methyltransferase